MPRSVTLNAIEFRENLIVLRTSAKDIEIPGSTPADLKQWINEQFGETDNCLLALGLACWLSRDPQLATPSAVTGKTITINLGGSLALANGVIKVS